MNNIKLNKYRDGGTIRIEFTGNEVYFIDGRVRKEGKVDTHGRIFNKYPGEPYAQQLSIEQEIEIYDRLIPNLSDDLRVLANQLNSIINNRRELMRVEENE